MADERSRSTYEREEREIYGFAMLYLSSPAARGPESEARLSPSLTQSRLFSENRLFFYFIHSLRKIQTSASSDPVRTSSHQALLSALDVSPWCRHGLCCCLRCSLRCSSGRRCPSRRLDILLQKALGPGQHSRLARHLSLHRSLLLSQPRDLLQRLLEPLLPASHITARTEKKLPVLTPEYNSFVCLSLPQPRSYRRHKYPSRTGQ